MSKLLKLLRIFRKKKINKPQYQCEVCENAYDFKDMNFFCGHDYQMYAVECICDSCLSHMTR